MTPTRRTAGAWPLLLALAAVTTTGCTHFLPSHPIPPSLGARLEGDTIVVKFPVCPTDEIHRVEVYDWDDDEHDTPRIVWWATDPTTPSARAGLATLWTGEGFAHAAARPAASAIPPHIGVAYEDPTGDGRDGVFTVRTIEKAELKPGQYWTHDGPLTADEIDGQLKCAQ
ncbi:hypothetical protein ABZ464_41840 [Streptomyces sp. NPDC005820]|uniref:hypothetical protein n=1 Tax=Streptomyces sp. NPDC005820 TaxID=3157069 RepID=UPI0033D4E6BC